MYYYNNADRTYIHTTCIRGDIDNAEKLLKRDNSLANQRNENGMTPAHVTVNSTEGTILEDLLNVLIYFGADPNSRSPVTGDTPLQSAISYGRYESAEIAAPILLRAGADPKIANKVGQTAIDAAVVHNYLELAELLSNYKQDPSLLDQWEEKRGQRPTKEDPQKAADSRHQNDSQPKNNNFLNAVIRGDRKLAGDLLNNGASINYRNEEGFTALHYAVSRCASDRLAMTEFLVNNMADVNAVSQENDTPLTLAIKKNHSETEVYNIAKCLLDNGANKDISDLDERTPLMLASERHLHRVVELLGGREDKPPTPEPTPQPPPPSDPNQFEGPFHHVHELCQDENLSHEKRIEELDVEFNRGVYINIRTKVDQDTCLLIACRREDEQLVKYLLDKDATVDVSNMNKETPLSVTRKLKNLPIEKLLLDAQKRQQAKLRWKKAGIATAATKSKGCSIL